MTPSSIGFARVAPPTPSSAPEVYLLDENRSPLIRAELVAIDWAGMGGERSEDMLEGPRWPNPQDRGDAKIIAFKTDIAPDWVIVDVYHEFDELAWEVIPVRDGELLGANLSLECGRRRPGCFETDGAFSYWEALPKSSELRELVNVYASWTVRPFNPEEPTVGANWRFHFVNDDINKCNWFRQLLRTC